MVFHSRAVGYNRRGQSRKSHYTQSSFREKTSVRFPLFANQVYRIPIGDQVLSHLRNLHSPISDSTLQMSARILHSHRRSREEYSRLLRQRLASWFACSSGAALQIHPTRQRTHYRTGRHPPCTCSRSRSEQCPCLSERCNFGTLNRWGCPLSCFRRTLACPLPRSMRA